MSAVPKPEPRMTVEEYFALEGVGHAGKVELVHGRLRMQSYASGGHGTIQANITRHIGNGLARTRPGCRVGNEVGVIPSFDPQHNVRRPDIVVTCTAHTKGERAFPDPILIVEVLSQGNARDTWESIQACSTIGTVAEILVVDSEAIDVQVFRRGAKGIWPGEPERVTADGVIRLAAVGLELAVADIYRGTYLVPGD